MKMKPEKKIMIIGGYGFSNIGDEAILSGLLKYLSDLGYDKDDIIVFSRNPDRTKRIHGVNSSDRIFYWMLHVHKIIIGGGELFSEYKHLLYINLFLIIIARLLGKRVDLVGIGIDIRRYTSKLLVRYLLRLVNNISVRDVESLKILRDLGFNNILLTPDLAFYNLKPQPSSLIDEFMNRCRLIPKNFVILVLRPFNNPALISYYMKFIRELVADDPVVFVPFSTHPYSYEDNDLNILPYIKKMIENKQIILFDQINDLHPNEVLYLISKSRLVISSRLHPLIFAKAVNVEAIAILPPYQTKKISVFIDKYNIPVIPLPDNPT